MIMAASIRPRSALFAANERASAQYDSDMQKPPSRVGSSGTLPVHVIEIQQFKGKHSTRDAEAFPSKKNGLLVARALHRANSCFRAHRLCFEPGLVDARASGLVGHREEPDAEETN